ncbi:DNA internalization-related competence protein ComEC/Rec2 [Desulfosarcina alkanivorans]|uniref:DNA internalization-related competence protein ComEC/Rec2 n=1 Tax=Desulfosarcina alkanivorans TaxID=571177 RepID=A0A5K7YW44_9BACT|nr:DNA internalization-related competence protein ComEC/Rec2 [Desulfosarcina alkanivorans]BBO71301.1 DNA internalization-related competence protein ComEC/Rec2 [Desulfosarcina alkanivorans]
MIPLAAIPASVYYRPAVPLTLSLMAGIVLGRYLPGIALPVLATVLAAAAWLTVRLRRAQPARWSPLLAALAAGYLAMVPWASPRSGPDHLAGYLDTGYWRVHGVVADSPVVRFGRTRAVLDVTTLARDDRSHAVRGRIRLTVTGEAALAPGDRLIFPARIRSFRNFRNPGGFDYRRHMAYRGIHGSAWVPLEKLRRNGSDARAPADRLVHAARGRLGQMIDSAAGDSHADEKAVLKALVFGDRSGIDEGLRERFNRAGVGHLLAISGLHVGIVATLAFGGWRWLFSFFPPLLWRGWGRPWAAAATLVPVLAYGMLAGMSPSTQRAEIMVAVFLLAMIMGRSHDTINTLAVAALAILVFFPPALFSISFQLSFAAVLAIVYGLEKIDLGGDKADRFIHRMRNRLTGFLLVSALAIAGTTPLVLFHFNRTSLVGIAANLMLVPLVGFVAVPIGLVSAFAAIFCEPAAALGFRLSVQILRLASMGLDFFSGLSLAAVKVVTPSLVEILLYYLAGWCLLNLRKTTVARWVLAAALVMALGDGLYWSYQRFWHRDLRVTAVDVGQGGCTLLELPGGGVVLYDGGGFSDNRLFDMGRRVVAPLLWRRKIATVDILVLSHPNADHLNGLIYIADHFNVRELWTNGDANTTQGYGMLMAACRDKGIVVRRVHADTGDTVVGPVTFAVLHPGTEFLHPADGMTQEDRNNGSLVLKATLGETAFLLTGDIEAPAERQLVERAAGDLASTVLFAPHHGSRTSSSAELVAAVGPDVVVISAGAGNRFGFPHAEVMDRYRDAGCRVLCTGTHGAVYMRSDGKTVHVRPETASCGPVLYSTIF